MVAELLDTDFLFIPSVLHSYNRPSQDISLRLATLPVPKTSPTFPAHKLSLSTQTTAPDLVLPQLISVRTSINGALDIIDVSRWTGQSNDAHFISGQLRLLNDNLTDARLTLKGEPDHGGPKWNEGGSADENVSGFNAKCFSKPLL